MSHNVKIHDIYMPPKDIIYLLLKNKIKIKILYVSTGNCLVFLRYFLVGINFKFIFIFKYNV